MSRQIQRTNSSRDRSTTAMAERSLSHRAALHEPPPTLDSAYGYAYNTAAGVPSAVAPTPPSPHHQSPRLGPTTPSTPPLVALSSTPPAFGLGAPLIPPRNAAAASNSLMPSPPFSAVPTKLEDAPRSSTLSGGSTAAQQQHLQPLQHNTSVVPPMTSLDLLHSSPFKGGSVALSSLADSEFRTSSIYHQTNGGGGGGGVGGLSLDGEDDDDMPFAVDAEQTTGTLQHKKLQLFESKDELQSLTQQLQDFKAFGASLHQQ